MSFENFKQEDNRVAMNMDARAAVPKFEVGEIVYFRTGKPGDPVFPEKLFTNDGQGYEITEIGPEETHLKAVGETTKPPRKYKIENFRLIRKFLLLIAAMFILSTATGQTDTVFKKTFNIHKLRHTGKCYTDKEGVKYPVFMAAGDRLFIVRTDSNGKMKKQFLF